MRGVHCVLLSFSGAKRDTAKLQKVARCSLDIGATGNQRRWPKLPNCQKHTLALRAAPKNMQAPYSILWR